MFRIDKIHIKGFKEPEREVILEMSKKNITVVYGENGCGKTTLLRVIKAFLEGDYAFLISEKIKEIEFVVRATDEKNEVQEYIINIEPKKRKSLVGVKQSDAIYWDKESPSIIANLEENIKTTFFSTNRGLIKFDLSYISTMNEKLEQIKNSANKVSVERRIDKVILEAEKYIDQNSDVDSNDENHLYVDSFSFLTIDETLRETFENGEKSVINSMNNAFLATLDIALSGELNIVIPADFEQRFQESKFYFQSFLSTLDNNGIKTTLENFISSEKPNILEQKPLVKAMILKMLESAEKDKKENINSKAIQTLVNTFNDFLIRDKKLVVNSLKTYISLPNGDTHEIKNLSSGEKHLLCILYFFLIAGREKDLYLIDEPEISLSMKWQRKVLDLIAEFSPNAQIIVATHSPDIVNGHDEYLAKLD